MCVITARTRRRAARAGEARSPRIARRGHPALPVAGIAVIAVVLGLAACRHDTGAAPPAAGFGAPPAPAASAEATEPAVDLRAALASEDPGSLERVVRALAHLSPEGFRGVTMRGLESCRSDGQRTECEIQPLGDGDIRDAQERWPPFAGAGQDPDALGPPHCTIEGSSAVCIAASESLDGMQWTFERQGGVWWLVQVLSFTSSP